MQTCHSTCTMANQEVQDVTSCCINTNHKYSALLYSSVVTYLSTTSSSRFKLFFKFLINLRRNAITFSVRLWLLSLSIFKTCKSILSLLLVGRNSLEHFPPGPTNKVETMHLHDQQSNYSNQHCQTKIQYKRT